MDVGGHLVPLAAAAAALLLCAPGGAVGAQETGTVTGRVVDVRSGQTLESAQVHLPGLQMGSLTDARGRFLIVGVPAGEHQIAVELIGYSPESRTVIVRPGEATSVELRLRATALRLQELVVTGVAGSTPRVKLPFSVEKVDFSQMSVPPSSADGLIQGKVAGVSVVKGSGQPGDEASMILRGPTTITGSQSPLIIVDGVITDNTLADVDALDVESVEVVKGAAAASLYGSRAANGVIRITTKRGGSLERDEVRVSARNEFGVQDLEGGIGLSRFHPYELCDGETRFATDAGTCVAYDAVGREGTVVLDAFDGTQDPFRSFQDNPYPGVTRNLLDQFFDPGNFYSNHLAVAGRTASTSYRLSFTNQSEAGVVDDHGGYDRKNARLNLDHALRDDLDLQFNAYYSRSRQDRITSDAFFALTFLPPNADLTETDANGNLKIRVDPLSLEENPLYMVRNQENRDERERLMASIVARYSPAPWFELEANYSIDRAELDRRFGRPEGYEQIGGDPLGESVSNLSALESDVNASLTASLNRAFGDLTVRSKLRYLVEDQHAETIGLAAGELTTVDVPTLTSPGGARRVSAGIQDIAAEGFYLIGSADYRGTYVGDLLVRRDGSSLFGPDERWQTYYRASGAWRVAREAWWPLDAVDELKLRFSYGTAGVRPAFAAQYETYEVRQGFIRPVRLGNRGLKPAYAVEREAGLDLVLFRRLSTGITYAWSRVEDQILSVPLAGYFGFRSQWRNAGTLSSSTVEAFAEASILAGPDVSLSARLNFDRTRQRIADLDVPPYRAGAHNAFYMREGEPLGTFYGTRWATSCGDLPAGAPDCARFQVNDDGYLVYVGEGHSYQDGVTGNLWGTSQDGYDWGMPIPVRGEDGEEFLRLGRTTPDFNASLSADFRWKNLRAYVLLDASRGADIYNQTAQWAFREWRHSDVDQGGKPDGRKKPVAYYSVLYDVNAMSGHFVEDGSFVKLREVSLGYTFPRSRLGRLGGRLGLESATVTVIGRNLKTWTEFGGYDPEVGFGGAGAGAGAAAIGRIDAYQYPNFRSLTASLELVF